MPEPEFIDPNQFRSGPIGHASLRLNLLHQIKDVFDIVGGYIGKTLVQFEINFMRDSDLASEVVVWQSIVAAWQTYHAKLVGVTMPPDAQEKNLFGALILISTGVEDITKLNVPVDVGRKLLRSYDDLGKEG